MGGVRTVDGVLQGCGESGDNAIIVVISSGSRYAALDVIGAGLQGCSEGGDDDAVVVVVFGGSRR